MKTIRTVAVLGAGTMGHGIAQVAAQAGCDVHLADSLPGAAEAGLERMIVGVAVSRALGLETGVVRIGPQQLAQLHRRLREDAARGKDSNVDACALPSLKGRRDIEKDFAAKGPAAIAVLPDPSLKFLERCRLAILIDQPVNISERSG